MVYRAIHHPGYTLLYTPWVYTFYTPLGIHLLHTLKYTIVHT